MPVLPDKPPLLADANARFQKRRWTPLRVFAWTFLAASLVLWLTALPGVRGAARALDAAWRSSPAHDQLEARLHADDKAAWRPGVE